MRRAVLVAAAILVAACRQEPPGTCASHFDCNVGQECSGGVCIALATDHQVGSRCLRGGDCVAWAACAGQVCTLAAGACTTSADCAGWEECDATHACVMAPGRCASTAECRPWEVCNASFVCANGPGYCAVDADCGAWQQCLVHACATAPGFCAAGTDCQAWQDCGTDHLCALAPGMCGTGADCASWDVCDAAHACVHGPGYCAASADCAAWQTCNAVHACATAPGFCASSAECQVWEACNASSHVCENGPGYCASSADCAAWQECNAAHACATAPGFCGASADCKAWEICNAGHTCENGPLYCASSADCATWQMCGTDVGGGDPMCVTGLWRCATDADCEAPWEACGSDHVCTTGQGYCFDGHDCTAAEACVSHVCVPRPSCDFASGVDWCPWYEMCVSGDVCELWPPFPGFSTRCYTAAECPAGMACADHLCVDTWRATQIATGAPGTTCALTSGQEVWCWGGAGLVPPAFSGTFLVPGTSGAVGVAISRTPASLYSDGWGVGFVTFADGTVRGWGANPDGQLCEPAGNPASYATPGPPIPALVGVTQVHGYPICGIDSSTNLVCWGDNSVGQIPGAGLDVATPTPIAGLPSGVTTFDANGEVCAIVAGELWCWATLDVPIRYCEWMVGDVPTRIDVGAPVIDVAVGGGFTCAVVEGGDVRCWGCNENGEVGNGRTELNPVYYPTTVVGLAGPAVHVEAVDSTACVLLASGGVQCWGSGVWGELGTGEAPYAQVTPRYPVGLESGVVQLEMGAASRSAQCALKSDGTVWCWGDIREPRTVNGADFVPYYVPVQVNAPPP